MTRKKNIKKKKKQDKVVPKKFVRQNIFKLDNEKVLIKKIKKQPTEKKLYELAEVVKDLNKKTDVIAEQSYSERQLFEKAYERLKSEFEVVLGEKAKFKMDKALDRIEKPTA